MGDVKNNMKATTTEGKDFFKGIREAIRPAKKDDKQTAQTYVDQLVTLDKTLNDLVVAKRRDVEHESSRYEYNRKILTELEIQQMLLQQLMESVARSADIAEADSKKKQ